MSKITNDRLTQSGTGCFIHMATVGVKGVKADIDCLCIGCNITNNEDCVVARYLSVRTSVTRQYYVQTARHIIIVSAR